MKASGPWPTGRPILTAMSESSMRGRTNQVEGDIQVTMAE